MNHMRNKLYLYPLTLGVISSVLALLMSGVVAVSPVLGQERTGGTVGVEADRLEVDATTAVETNVCDGVTCADGSCAATVAECTSAPAEATAATVVGDDLDENDETLSAEPVSVGDGDSDGDGIDDDVERASYNNSRSNRSVIRDPDSDSDSDGDGLDDGTERAQNHNSSRSNRTEGVAAPDYNDPDDDGDGVPTQAAGGGIDKASPLLFEAVRGEGDLDGDGFGDVVEAQGTGFKVSRRSFSGIDGEVVASDNTGKEQLRSVKVRGTELRQWSEEERATFAQMRRASATGTPQYAAARVAEMVLGDERIESVEMDETAARMEYRARLNLLGFIPLQRTVQAEADREGSASITYPWYSFLATKPDSETIRSTLNELQIEIMMTLSADPI